MRDNIIGFTYTNLKPSVQEPNTNTKSHIMVQLIFWVPGDPYVEFGFVLYW